jgi:hypothetical protein
MSQIRSVLGMMLALVGRFGLLLLGAVIALALFHNDDNGRANQALPKQAGRAYISDDGRIIHIVPNVEQGSPVRTLVIHRPDGRELVNFHVYQDGRFTLDPSTFESFDLTVHKDTSGKFRIGLGPGARPFELDSRIEVPAEIVFKDASRNIIHKLSVDEKGIISSHTDPDHMAH